MFNRFKSQRQNERSPSEDPAAPFSTTRRDAGASSELIDYALIDATVNEWMAEAELERNGDADRPKVAFTKKTAQRLSSGASSPTSSAMDTAESTNAPEAPGKTPSSGPLRPKSASASFAGRRAMTSTTRTTGIGRTGRRIDGTSSSRSSSSRRDGPDRVLRAALKSHLLSEDQLKRMIRENHADGYPDWRTVCTWMPDQAHALERLAADVYGFRPVLICQMSTLVLADLLTMRLPAHYWRPMMEVGVIPVVEHGEQPKPSQRVLCVSNDPSRREVRTLLEDIKAFNPELAYADAYHVQATMKLLSQHVPSIGAEVYTTRPALKRIDSNGTAGKAA